MEAFLSNNSPMMCQWLACKKRVGGALLLFRLGDFYEAFQDDASILSRSLNIVLTQRNGTPMSGFPHSQIEIHLRKLIYDGHIVAIAEQVSEKDGQLTKRVVTKVVTPATIDSLSGENNFFAALLFDKGRFGISFAEISRGELLASEMESYESSVDLLCSRHPKEILVKENLYNKYKNELLSLQNYFPTHATRKGKL